MQMLKIFALALAASTTICGAAKSESPYGPCPTPDELRSPNGNGFIERRVAPIFSACIEKGGFKIHRINKPPDEPENFAFLMECNQSALDFIDSCKRK
jgi:hypothetical protein